MSSKGTAAINLIKGNHFTAFSTENTSLLKMCPKGLELSYPLGAIVPVTNTDQDYSYPNFGLISESL